ncbi:hypothetical protein BDZ85DRAFT_91353 [Elsinoe ampelina]|uniref:Aminoglycoside phosphotransferase domain-containing protein n=1 Tax=Elsinoe ampelina TaxID=302913 RepID=A0A6A6GHU9_9PEZI|nr:hypothetical protein BDZ85DRAFT_91353 [Elsinoe ampelina]
MATTNNEYNVDDEIATFFSKTTVVRETCHALARELTASDRIEPVSIQGVCSYTLYAGDELQNVIQFRLKSLGLKLETSTLARQIYGDLVSDTKFIQQLGEDSTTDGRQPLLVYNMTRIQGISRLDFILAKGFPENSLENKLWRKNLIQDVARFFSLTWTSPQPISQSHRAHLFTTYRTDLQTLLTTLPPRFHPTIQHTLASLPTVFRLPMVLLHKDFNECNILVHPTTCHLAGVIDWAEAEIGPFGTNLHSLQGLMSKLHLRDGWVRYEDYDDLVRAFWGTFGAETGVQDDETVRAIRTARAVGLLRSRGFAGRIGGGAAPEPIRDDERGRYNLMILEGLLLSPGTRFEDVVA